MMFTIFNYINPIKLIVLFTFIYCCLFLKKTTIINKCLFSLLLLALVTEVINSISSFYNFKLGFISNFYVILHHSIWIIILRFHFKLTFINLIIITFISISILDIIINKGLFKFNYQTFVLGSLCYLILFIYESAIQLKKENLSFFQTNKFLLICAPLLFFIGLSFMFGFKSKELTSTYLFMDIKLYSFISFLVNIIYYTLINLYIYKERKLQNG